jgi:hypothetical protein
LAGSLGDTAGLAADLDADGRGVPESTVRSVRLTTSASITIPAWLLFAMFHRCRDNVPESLPERVRVHALLPPPNQTSALPDGLSVLAPVPNAIENLTRMSIGLLDVHPRITAAIWGRARLADLMQ